MRFYSWFPWFPMSRGRVAPRIPTQRSALRCGVTLGVINGVLAVLNLFVPDLAQIDGFVSVVAGIALLTLVGIEVGRRAGAATPAVVAGLVAGAISWAVNALVVVALTLIFADRYLEQLVEVARSQHQSLAGLTTGVVIAGNLILLILFLCVALAFGAFLGGLGGILGKRQAHRQHAAAPEQPQATSPRQVGAS